jgi:hypothetical protein
MSKGVYILTGIVILITLSFGLVFNPVPTVLEEQALLERGIVKSISEGGINDIVFVLENTDTRFYINRGLENGLDLNILKEKLIGNEVVFKYPRYWTPLDWNNKLKHLSKVEFGKDIIFNEFR